MKKLNLIVKNILKLESTNLLFDFKFKNYSVWSYYRMYFYYDYTQSINLLDSSVSSFKVDIEYIKKISGIFDFLKLFEKKEYLVLEHPRSNKDKIDIYTYNYVKHIGEEKCSFFAFSNNGIINKKDRVIILDLLKIFSKIFSKIFFIFIGNKKFINFKQFLIDLEMNKNMHKKYVKNYKRYYLELRIQYYYYTVLLKIKNTKKVILTVSYYNMPLIFAAKNLGIEVTEMQHGVISKYHLGYHYPYYETNFFPDVLVTFSEFWNKTACFPKNTKILAYGNDFLATKKFKINKEKNTILVVSQSTIGKKLEKLILQNIDSLSNYKIYFKLHPSEFNKYENKYKDIIRYKNIEIVLCSYSIEELQKFCEYQIGIYSTAIYEGIEKGCKTVLLQETGIEYMEDLINQKIVFVVDYSADFQLRLNKALSPKDVVFFEKFKLSVGE